MYYLLVMVSRADRPAHPAQQHDRAPESSAGRLLLAWRRILTGASRAAVRTLFGHGPRLPVRRLIAGLRDPAGTVCTAEPGTLRALRVSGMTCLAIGVVGALALGLLGSTDIVITVVTAAGTVVWAFVRLLILRAMAPGVLRRPALVKGIWGLGLVPYVIGFTSLLRSAAFGASAWITYRGARGAGATAREAGLMVGTAFGSQIAVVLASWAMRGGTALFLGLATG